MLQNTKMMSVTLVLLVLLVPLFAGCYTPAGRSAGDVVDDTTIGTTVKAKLFDEDQLSGFAIGVKVFEGEVTLTGAVDSQEHKELAAQIARSVKGVVGVNNLLQLKE
ncbi:MAG TPA: BON domain-containing protein [Desulfopila sp.]|nr:BON domain-containing protein [Desulfopila sp.]